MIVKAAADAASSGINWLGVIGAVGVGTVLSSLITGMFLTMQQRRQDDREDRRVEAEEKRLARERKEALDDYWRDSRHRAHVALLGGLADARDSIFEAYYNADDDAERLRFELPIDLSALLRQVADVRLLSRAEAGQAAQAAYGAMNRLRVGLLLYGSADAGEKRSKRETTFILRDEAFGVALENYRRAVRADLGTDGLTEDPPPAVAD